MAISTGAAILGGSLLGAAGSIIGGNKAAKSAERAAKLQAQAQREALEYQKQIEALPLEFRDQALPALAGFYGLGGGNQMDIINQVKNSPFYQANLDQMEEAILRNQSMTGGFRSGSAQSNLATGASNLLQGLTNQRLAGISQFAFPQLNTNAIAQMMQGIGQTQGQGIIAAANAKQAGYGGALNAITGGINLGIQQGVI